MRFFILFSALLHGALLYYVSDIELLPQQYASGENRGPIQIALTSPSVITDTTTILTSEKDDTTTPPLPAHNSTTPDTAITSKRDARQNQTTALPQPTEQTPVAAQQQPNPNPAKSVETATAGTATHSVAKAANGEMVAKKPTTDHTAKNNHSTRATNGNETRHQLQQALAPHFNYPRLARKRGWQGTVEVGLHIATDGRLSNIHIMQSSGHHLLDHAALKSLQQLERLPGS